MTRAPPTVRRLLIIGVLALESGAGSAVTRADPLDELRERLAALPGHDPIRAVVEVHVTVTPSDGEPPISSSASGLVEADRETVRIEYARALLEEVERRARAPRADSEGDPPPEAIEQLMGSAVDALLDHARHLDSMISRGAVITSDGETLTFEVEPAPRPGYVQVTELELELSLRNGMPAAARTRRVSRGGLLFLRVENEESIEQTFEVVGDRLVVTASRETMTVRGMGVSFQQVTERTVIVREKPPSPSASGPR
jgi:hypothetical protein